MTTCRPRRSVDEDGIEPSDFSGLTGFQPPLRPDSNRASPLSHVPPWCSPRLDALPLASGLRAYLFPLVVLSFLSPRRPTADERR